MTSLANLRLLDTNTVSYLSNHRYTGLVEHFHKTSADAPVCISAVTEAELRFGLAKVRSARLAEALEAILRHLPSLAWDSAVVQHFVRSAPTWRDVEGCWMHSIS